MGLGSRTIWGRTPNFKPQLAKSVKIFSETVPFYTLFQMISSQRVHDTFIYNMDKFCILIIIWSIDIWDDVHILVRALIWLSGEPPTGRVAVPSLIYPPFPFN